MGIEVPRRRIDSFAAVLWDMDGTLVDTEPYWTVAELALAERYGGRWTPEQSLEVIGFDLIDAARLMREQMGIDPSPEQIVEEMLDSVIDQVEHAVPWREGAVELLASLGEAGVPARWSRCPGRASSSRSSRSFRWAPSPRWSPETVSIAASPTRSPT